MVTLLCLIFPHSTANMSLHPDKHAIVLDVGTRYVKCGVSEERAPRCIVRWEISERLSAGTTTAELREYLATQLHKIFFDVLHINPRHRRFVLCEDLVGPQDLRRTLVDVLFVDLKASAVMLVPAAIAALFATSHHTALVVDCGYKETRLLPVYKGIPLSYCYDAVPVGTASCCKTLGDALDGALQQQRRYSAAELESIVERACFVRQDENEIMDAVDAKIQIAGSQQITVPGASRSQVCEHLFSGADVDGCSIVSRIEELYQRLPVDIRTPMVENLLVIGGMSMVPGFPSRLRHEVQASLSGNGTTSVKQVGLVQPLFPRNVLVWVGASVMTAADAGTQRWILSSDYTTSGYRCLPDWMSLAVVDPVEL